MKKKQFQKRIIAQEQEPVPDKLASGLHQKTQANNLVDKLLQLAVVPEHKLDGEVENEVVKSFEKSGLH